jgi:hypothetical protein
MNIFNKKNKIFIKSFSIIHILIILFSFIYTFIKAYATLSYREGLASVDANGIWQWWMYFTIQTNILIGIYLFSYSFLDKKVSLNTINYLRIISLIMISIVSTMYWVLVFKNELADNNNDVFDWINSAYFHGLSFILLLAHFFYDKKINKNKYEIDIKAILMIGFVYYIVYFIVVVILIQWIDPNHWTVYGNITRWYHWIQKDNSKTSTIFLVPIVFVSLVVFNYLYTYTNNKLNTKI